MAQLFVMFFLQSCATVYNCNFHIFCFKILHIFCIAVRSGLQTGQSSTYSLFFLRHAFVICAEHMVLLKNASLENMRS